MLIAILTLSLPGLLGAPNPQAAPISAGEIVPRDWLVVAPVDGRGRRPLRPDAVFARYLLDPRAAPPCEGESLSGERGQEQAWKRARANEEGALETRRSGYAYTLVNVERTQVYLARLRGAERLYVNGDGFAGDYYRQINFAAPVLLVRGANHVFVTATRGQPQLRFTPPPAPVYIASAEATFPDLVEGELPATMEAAVVIVNATTERVPLLDIQLQEGAGWSARSLLLENGLPPLGFIKVPLTIELKREGLAAGKHAITFACRGREQTFELQVVAPGTTHRRTFRSTIDDSIQEYAVVPPRGKYAGERGLVLTLHGAGVYCLNQARCYAPKPDLWVVAPTNRRPFGFDWQDWGRTDAYEVLEHALARSDAVRSRLYVTGHSMGGHGVWHLGANDPDTFAAIAPSAGWISFDSYTGRPQGKWTETWQRADGSGLALELLPNLEQLPTFILHGAKDGRCTAREGERMLALLRERNATVDHHFQEGAGHWWDGEASAGTDCVDWPGIFELFRRHRRAENPAEIEFVTADPVIDSQHHWLRVERPLVHGPPVRVKARWLASERRVEVETTNAARLVLTPPTEHAVAYHIDGQALPGTHAGEMAFVHSERWQVAAGPLPAGGKGPARSGPFKQAFARRFVLVHGTAGTAHESAELLARTRFDAQRWWYRGNDGATVLSDRDFLQRADSDFAGRNVILYGNADTNAAWGHVLPRDCPLTVHRGSITLGDDTFTGAALATVFLHPRRNDPEALVGVFAAAGSEGTRLGYILAPFIAGAGFPDYILFTGDVLTRGDEAVLRAGWFNHDWSYTE